MVDLLSGDQDLVCRFNGGANAGHTICVGDKTYKLNLLPSGIVHEKTLNVIGNGTKIIYVNTNLTLTGVVCDLEHMLGELSKIDIPTNGRLLISDRCHVLFKFHQIIDGLHEKNLGKDSIGTTKKGIGPCYATKADRINLRVGDLKYWKHFEQNLRSVRIFIGIIKFSTSCAVA